MRLHLHEWGDAAAPPLVCLHGVSAHGRRFRRLAEERLAARYRVLAPDLRGHGRSDYEPPWTFPTYVDDILETLDAADVDRAHWLGHSFGGRLVLEVAAWAPDRVERAVLLDPAIRIAPSVAMNFAEEQYRGVSYASPEEAVERRLAANPATPRAAAEEEVTEHLVASADGRWRFRYAPPAVASVYGELATAPPPPETLRAPTLLLYAPEFGLVREKQVAAYTEALGPLLEVVTVPGGHVVYWDAYDATADAVERFLAA